MPEMRNAKGITLIELVVVMVIIAIGAVALAPNMAAWIRHYRLSSVTRDVVSTLRTAQMKAVTTNMEFRVSFTPGIGAAGSYILQRHSGGVWVDEGVSQSLPSGIAMTVAPSGSNDKEFNPNSTSSSGSITLTSSKGVKKINLSPSTGKIRVE